MSFLLLKKLPRFEHLLEAATQYPTLEPSAVEAFLNVLFTGDLLFNAEGDHLSAHRMSQGRFAVMMILLHREGGCGATELADRAGVSRATMSGLLDILERDGRVQREQEPEDRRAVRVELTAKGRAEMEALLPGYFGRVAEILKPLDEPERKQLVHLLKKLQSGLVAPGEAEMDHPCAVEAKLTL
ncbi:MAG: MarR family transcriptional regulator [Chthoniobacteraceae bacterium]